MEKIIVFATNNRNKVIEVNQILSTEKVPFQLRTLKEMSIDVDIVEDGDSIQQNASIKSNFIYANYSKNAIGEDTGLEVEALHGEPGIHTARYAGEDKNATKNMNKLLMALKNHTNRKAQFRTVISLILDGEETTFEGIVRGNISHEISGDGGFGYDPVFIPEGYTKSFANLPAEVKNKISHRSIAVKKLLDYLKNKD